PSRSDLVEPARGGPPGAGRPHHPQLRKRTNPASYLTRDIQSDRPIVEVAGELGINPGTLGNWVKKYRLENPEPDKKMTPADYGRLAELEEQNRRLKMENEFLKKAAAFFAREQG